jgi:hypothetical protein
MSKHTNESKHNLSKTQRVLRHVVVPVVGASAVSVGIANGSLANVASSVWHGATGTDLPNQPPKADIATLLKGNVTTKDGHDVVYRVKINSGPGATKAERDPGPWQAVTEIAQAEAYRTGADNVQTAIGNLTAAIDYQVGAAPNGGVDAGTTFYLSPNTPIVNSAALNANPNIKIDRVG